jgi:uncharacterized membrane protein
MNIEVNTKAKAYATDYLEINAPVEKVFLLVANIKNWPKWFDGVTKVQMDGEPAEGITFIWKANGYNLKSKIHTLRTNSEIGWTGKMWWIKAIHNWQFESLPNGNTKVVIKECFEGFCSSLLKNTLKSGIKKDLLILKRTSEN